MGCKGILCQVDYGHSGGTSAPSNATHDGQQRRSDADALCVLCTDLRPNATCAVRRSASGGTQEGRQQDLEMQAFILMTFKQECAPQSAWKVVPWLGRMDDGNTTKELEGCPSTCERCKAGGAADGGVELVNGRCEAWCSSGNFCGITAVYTMGGIDCSGCKPMGEADCELEEVEHSNETTGTTPPRQVDVKLRQHFDAGAGFEFIHA